MSHRRLDARPDKPMSRPNMDRAMTRLMGELNAVLLACPKDANACEFVTASSLLEQAEEALRQLWEK